VAETAHPAPPAAAEERARRTVTGTRALGLLAVAAVFATTVGPLHDNSLFTHLATGRLIWDGTIPRTDPYTFTAAGEPWVVQSWLVSLVIGALEELVSLGAVRLFFGLVAALAVGLCWLLSAPARTPLVRLLVVVPVVVIAVTGWAQRPYLVAFAGLAAVLLVLEGRWRPAVLVPVLWVWVNAHGSWPLAVAATAATWLGARLDRADTSVERASAKWLAAGLAASAVNPYGPGIFTVPFVALGRREVFSHILEWQPPTYRGVDQLVFLVALAGIVVVLARGASWRTVLPVLGFALAALYSMRNISPAVVVAVPAVSRVLGSRATWGAVRVPARPVAALAGALAALGVVHVATSEHVATQAYPVAATEFLEEEGLDPTQATLVAREYVGNYFELVYGTDARVFVDDRFEVVPGPVAEDVFELLDAGPDWEEALARYAPDAVLWEADEPLTRLLEASEAWDVAYADDEFVVAVPAS
jgi:hypothetical protein